MPRTAKMHERTLKVQGELRSASTRMADAAVTVGRLADDLGPSDVGRDAAVSVKTLMRLLALLLEAVIAVARAIEARADAAGS